MANWTIWHFEHSETRGVYIDVRFARPVTVRDIERIEALCAIWKQVAAEDAAAASPPAPPSAEKAE